MTFKWNMAGLMCIFFIVIALRTDCLASVLSLSYKRVTLQPSSLTKPLVIDSLFHSLIKGIGVCVCVCAHVHENIPLPLCYNKSCAVKTSSAASARANSPWRVSSLHVQRTSYGQIKQTGTCCSFVLFNPPGKHARWEEHPWICGLILLSLSTIAAHFISGEKRDVAGRRLSFVYVAVNVSP